MSTDPFLGMSPVSRKWLVDSGEGWMIFANKDGFFVDWWDEWAIIWKQHDGHLLTIEEARKVAKRRARASRIKRHGMTALLAAAVGIIFFGIMMAVKPYLPEPDPSSVPQFHGENK